MITRSPDRMMWYSPVDWLAGWLAGRLDGNIIDRAATAMQTSLARQPANMFPVYICGPDICRIHA
jgi:hypothetical protein